MATANFQFTTLAGTEQAGHTSINALITSIDNVLTTRMPSVGTTSGSNQHKALIGNASGYYVAGLIGNANIDSAAAIAYSKLNLTNSIVSADIVDGTIVNGDINASAAIAYSKLALSSSIQTSDFAAGATAPKATDLTGSTVGLVYQQGTDDTTAIANGTSGQILRLTGSPLVPTWQNVSALSIDTADLADDAVTYAKLNDNAKTYDVPTSGTGVYFTASGDFTSDSLSTANTQNPVVVSAASSAIDLSLPNNIGTEGCTITVCQTGSGAVTIKPKSGSAATINGSTSNTYVLGAQYSVVTLLCLSNSGSNGTWVITGDYI